MPIFLGSSLRAHQSLHTGLLQLQAAYPNHIQTVEDPGRIMYGNSPEEVGQHLVTIDLSMAQRFLPALIEIFNAQGACS